MPSTAAPVEAAPLPCDPMDPSACLLPWPNDAFTAADPSTPTGRRLAIDPSSPPENTSGVPIDVTDQNRADGFSPGSAILVHVPGLDLEASGIAPSTDIGASLADDAPILLIDAVDGSRWPYWAELDAQAASDDTRLLIVHPAVSLSEGHRYLVALRDLQSAAGPVPTPVEFTDALDTGGANPDRASHLQRVVDEIAAAGADTSGLYLAWDFTVASTESLSGRLLHIRNDAYAAAGDAAPVYQVSLVVDDGGVRTVEGTITVPNYLTGTGGPGSDFELGPDGTPVRNATNPDLQAPFLCIVPTAPPVPTPTVVYGHGLLGSRNEIRSLAPVVALGSMSVCATDEIGMSSEDIPTVVANLNDLSNFNQQPDRMQQGLLDMQFLGRAINSPDGFAAHSAFTGDDGQPVIAPGKTSFLGNSQGGILGGAASAISTEWTNVGLGVPGIDYSLLLTRSSDWPQFESVFNVAYTGDIDRVLAIQLIQLLWDRGENDGYAQHLTANPYAGIEPKKVLLIAAFGDHQVANVATDVLARTIDATLFGTGLEPGRSNDVEPFFGIEHTTDTEIDGSAYVMWDYGNPPPPPVNLPPTEPEFGEDPHGKGSSEPRVIQMAVEFLTTGVIDVPCDSACVSDSVGG
jgi:hypothetical protein